MVVAYHGRRFHGFQVQPGRRTVQGVLEAALVQLCGGAPVELRAAGRTDAGVHARGQVVSVRMTTGVPDGKMVLALASVLPDDVAVLRADRMPLGFDAKKFSIGKRYVYRVRNGVPRDPFVDEVAWHVRARLDLDALRTAAAHFVGEKDYESFRSTGCDAAHARRFLWRVDVAEEALVTGRLLSIEVRGNAFCRHMVRTIAGTLVDVARGRYRVDDVPRMFAARARAQAGVTAPPQGLTLEEVWYPDTARGAGIPDDAVFPGWPIEPEDWPPSDDGPPARVDAADDTGD